MDSSTCQSQWSNLPKDLLELITKHLQSPIDHLRLRSVCAEWRSSLHLFHNNNPALQFPVKLPFPICIDPDLRASSVLVTQTTIYKISNTSKRTKSWMIRVQESSAENGKMHLKEPIFPSLFKNSTKKFSKVLNLLDFRVSEVTRAYDLEFGDGKLRTSILKKVVASSSKDDLAVMALHRRGNLGVWKIGDKKWTQIEDGGEWCKYIDVAYHKGKFYAVDIKGLSISVDSSHQITYITSPSVLSGFEYYDDRGRYLVNSLGNLFLVDNPPNRSCNIHFNVYMLNEEEKRWIQVNSLGNQALFLGDNCSFSVSAGDFLGLRGNCMYFSVYGHTVYNAYSDYYAWLYDMEDDSAKPLSTMPAFTNPFRQSSNWLRSKQKRLAALHIGI